MKQTFKHILGVLFLFIILFPAELSLLMDTNRETYMVEKNKEGEKETQEKNAEDKWLYLMNQPVSPLKDLIKLNQVCFNSSLKYISPTLSAPTPPPEFLN